MWSLMNKLFGWDYIAWENSCDRGVRRVHKGHNGECFYWRYRNLGLADRIVRQEDVIWLTCPPSKYFGANQ